MPNFSEIHNQLTTPLTDLEREIVRQVLNITGEAGSANYIDSQTRMSGLTQSQNQVVRAIIASWLEDIGFDTTKTTDKSEINYDTTRDRDALADELRRMLYPDSRNNPFVTTDTLPVGSLTFIPINYGVGSDEYE